MRVIIVGGGIVGSFLAEMLSGKNEVTIVEKDPETYLKLTERFEGIKLVAEDGCEPWVLEIAGVKGADLMLAVTGDDEDNLVISYLSKFEYDVPKVIARVNDPKNRWLFQRSWGVDVEVSMPDIMAKIIEEEISLGEVVTIMKLQASDVGLVEITLPADALAVGKRISDLALPRETLFVSVVRGEAMLIPRADTVLETGDKLLAMTHIDNKEELEDLLGHKS